MTPQLYMIIGFIVVLLILWHKYECKRHAEVVDMVKRMNNKYDDWMGGE